MQTGRFSGSFQTTLRNNVGAHFNPPWKKQLICVCAMYLSAFEVKMSFMCFIVTKTL